MAKEPKRRSADADQFASQGYQVQIRFDDFLLRPAMLKRNRVPELRELFFGAWQRPTSILTARLFKISAQFEF